MAETPPKTLVYDLELSPTRGFCWSKWETNVIAVTNPWYILSFSAKWIGGEHITKGLCDYKGYKPGSEDDSKLCKDLWKLLDQADIVVGQNNDSFDNKKANTRFLYWGMDPPSPYKSVDTKKLAKKSFSMFSNALDDMGEFLHLGRKVETGGFKLWEGCMAGDRKSWALMKKYNAHDVTLTERLYLKLRPWGPHPNLEMWSDKTACPKCAGHHLQSRGVSINQSTRYKRIHCQDCGAWSRSPLNEQERKVLRPL